MRKYILYMLPLLAVMTACKDLDKYPEDAVSSQTYFKTADQLKQYTNQFYTIMPSASSMYEEVSDLVAVTTPAAEVTGTRTIPADASSSSWTWGTLRHINYFLEHVYQCDDEAARNQYRGLTYFFRAYFYYDKIRRFGDVPWVDRALGSGDDELYAPRDNRSMVMQHVVQDLDSAYLLMSDDKSNVYAVNRFTALALKSRACLFEGTFCKYHNVTLADGVDRETYWRNMLEQAADAANLLMTTGGYSLYTTGEQPYRDLFTLGVVQGCPEYIMARAYDSSMGLKHNASSYSLSSSTGRPGFTKRFVNQYLKSDGTRFTDLADYATMDMGKEMTDRDPRMEQTIFRPGHYIRKGKTTTELFSVAVSATGYQLIKYVMDESQDTYNNSDNDMPLFRLAEVYLNYAEAKAELGTFTQADADISINLLRDRVKMPHLNVAQVVGNPCPYMESLYPNVSQTGKDVILEIRRERAVELVLEGHRYWDLMRWKEGKAFEQPMYGMYFAGVTKSKEDYSGFVNVDNDPDNYADVCAWINAFPFDFGVEYLEVGKELNLSRGTDGGYILSNGSQSNPNNGRQWREDRDYLYPIPIRERVLSKGTLTQNPGWDDGLTF